MDTEIQWTNEGKISFIAYHQKIISFPTFNDSFYSKFRFNEV